MEISTDTSKILVNCILSQGHPPIHIRTEVLEEVDQFKYLESTQTNDGTSLKDVKVRL